jgi:hypothetical protein
MRWRAVLFILLVILLLFLATGLIYNLPTVHDRLAWRTANLQAQVRRALNPPEEIVFVPGGKESPGVVQTVAQATLDVLFPSSSPIGTHTASPGVTPNLSPTVSVTPFPSETPAPTSTPIPAKVILTGVVHEYQKFNNCGPANLSMALSYWGWQGDQRDTRAFLRPNLEVDDKNVMPSEMVTFVEANTGLRALTRVGGDLDLLKRLLAAGFPVLIEMGHHPPKDWWMGHYLVINGYDDALGFFTAQDSLIQPDMPVLYRDLSSRWWRDFNYVYLVIYPLERETEISGILGPLFDEATSYRHAADVARAEIPNLVDRDLFFAWFNLGSSLVGVGDYSAAAEAYDQAFALYQSLSEEQRPYRLMWYQVGAYQAYYNTGRYQDVINLANTTNSWVSQPVLEESYYWRGLAYAALGELDRAIYDFKKAALINPNYAPPRQELERLGVALP